MYLHRKSRLAQPHAPLSPLRLKILQPPVLFQKCDENDDLSHNLRLAKNSLRHLSEELDEKSETAEQLREENQRVLQDRTILEEEVARSGRSRAGGESSGV